MSLRLDRCFKMLSAEFTKYSRRQMLMHKWDNRISWFKQSDKFVLSSEPFVAQFGKFLNFLLFLSLKFSIPRQNKFKILKSKSYFRIKCQFLNCKISFFFIRTWTFVMPLEKILLNLLLRYTALENAWGRDREIEST